MAPNLPSPPPARGGSRALACWAPGTWEGLSSVVPCKGRSLGWAWRSAALLAPHQVSTALPDVGP